MKLFDQILEKAQEYFDEAEVYFAAEKSTNFTIANDSLDSFDLSDSCGINLRGIKDGKAGYSYTEKLDEEAIDFLIQGAINNYELNDSREEERIPKKKTNDLEKNEVKNTLSEISTEEKMNLLFELSKVIQDYDERIDRVELTYGESLQKKKIKNSNALEIEEDNYSSYLFFHLIAKEKEEVKTYFAIEYLKELPKDLKKLAKKHGEKLLEKLGGSSTKSGSYPVILEASSFMQLLDVFMPNFSLDQVDKDLSLLKGKLNEKVASSAFTLVNNPKAIEGQETSFDDEGNPTREFEVLSEGILKTFFSNEKMAFKEEKESTGNGRRFGHKDTVGIGPDTLVVKPGEKTLEELFKEVDSGIFITELSGLHAGVNPISGDFSVSSGGFLIENGVKSKALEQITIAGNFLEFLENIVEFANDTKQEMAFTSTSYLAPSVYVKSLDIAGNE